MANLFQPTIQRALDSSGNPVNGAKLYFYLTGTTVDAAYYFDQAGATPGPHPLPANSVGLFQACYLNPDTVYRIKCTNATGSLTLYDVDPVRGYDQGMVQTAAADAIAAAAQADADAAQTAADVITTAAAVSTVTALEALTEAMQGGGVPYVNAYASTLPKGVTSGTIGGTAITGATPGTYALTSVGGSITGVAANLVVLTATTARIDIVNTGLGSGTTPPTWANPVGATLPVGTTLTAVVSSLIADQKAYVAASADSLSELAFRNNAGAIANLNNPDGTQIAIPQSAYLISLASVYAVSVAGTALAHTTGARISNADVTKNIVIELMFFHDTGSRFLCYAAQLDTGTVSYATWAALAAVTGTAGDKAHVNVADGGTHTDPTTGATGVDNKGRYTWATGVSGTGWRYDGTATVAWLSVTTANYTGVTPITLTPFNSSGIYVELSQDFGAGAAFSPQFVNGGLTNAKLRGFANYTTTPWTAAVNSLIPTGANTRAFSGLTSYFAADAGNASVTGSGDTGGGYQALGSLTSGLYNTAWGWRAGYTITTGNYNTLGGTQAYELGNGTGNSVWGYGALGAGTTASYCVAIGMQAASLQTSANYVISIGYRANYSNLTGDYAIGIGANALQNNLSAGNVGIGESAGFSVTTALNLTAVGRRSVYSKTTGDDCSYFGFEAGFSGKTTITNTGIGCTGIGAYALGHGRTGNYNTACGRAAGWYNDSGSQNAHLGYRSGYGNAGGSNDLTAGYYAGHNTPNGSNNVMLGASADYYIPPIGSFAAAAIAGGGMAVGAYAYRATFILDGVETAYSEPANVTTAGSNLQVSLTAIPTYTGPKTCSARKLYRTPVGGENLYYLVTTISDNTTTTYTDSTVDGSLGAQPTSPSGSIMLGQGATAYKSGQLVVGSTNARITEMFIGGGAVDTAPAAVTVSTSDASGTNVAGATHRIAGGRGTGTAKGGSVALSAAPAGSTGSSPNALVDYLVLDAAGFYTIKETTSAAVATPASGYNSLYFEGGALKFKTPAGTVMTVTAT